MLHIASVMRLPSRVRGRLRPCIHDVSGGAIGADSADNSERDVFQP